jgi:hypothetical protein
MSYSLDKDELTVMHTAGHALRAEVDANQSGIGRQRLAAPAGTTRHRLDFIPTLTRILENEEVKSAARKFVRQVGVTPAFWRDLLSSAASGPQDFMQAPKLTNRQQADVVSSVVDAAEKLQQALEYALVPVYPSVDEDKFFQEVSKLRSAYRSPRAPTSIVAWKARAEQNAPAPRRPPCAAVT